MIQFIDLYSRYVYLMEIRYWLSLSRFPPESEYLVKPTPFGLLLSDRIADLITPPGPGFGWGYYYSTFREIIVSWLL